MSTLVEAEIHVSRLFVVRSLFCREEKYYPHALACACMGGWRMVLVFPRSRSHAWNESVLC